jgi:hypothetical protein
MKKILKQIEVELNPQESFAKMDKDRDMKNGIWGSNDALEPPNGEEGLGRNQKRENRGPEECKEEKQQIRLFPREEKTPHQNASNGSHSRAEEDASPQDPEDGSQYTYSTSTLGPLPRHQQRRPPSSLMQISSAP